MMHPMDAHEAMLAEERPRAVTYILPTASWACLLDIILRDAPPESVIETYTEAMQELSERAVAAAGRSDMTVRMTPIPSATPSRGRAA